RLALGDERAVHMHGHCAAACEQKLAWREARKYRVQRRALFHDGETELARGEICCGHADHRTLTSGAAAAIAKLHHRTEEVVAVPVEQVVREGGAGGDGFHHLTLHDSL